MTTDSCIVRHLQAQFASLSPGAYELARKAYNGRWQDRTRVMAKQHGLPGATEIGLVARAMSAALPYDPAAMERVFERYVDIGISTGHWWHGQQKWLWVAEVENDPREFLGTVSDLLRVQARRKLAVFYDLRDDAQSLQQKIAAVVQHFHDAGFRENSDTRYEVISLPGQLQAGTVSQIRAISFRHDGAELLDYSYSDDQYMPVVKQ